MLASVSYRAALGLLLSCLLPLTAAAQGAPGAQAAKPLPANAWLSRIQEAATQRNYQGTMVFTAGGAVSSSRIVHYCEGPQQYERIEMLDGKMRTVFRHNDLVHTLWPAEKVAVVEQRADISSAPSLLRTRPDQRLLDSYDVVAEDPDRVAGHDAQVLVLKPRDAHRFAQRLWAERGSWLLLRADVLAPDGRVLESAAFSDVTIDVAARPDAVLQPMNQLDGFRVVHPKLSSTDLATEGWSLNEFAGFKLVSCVKRPVHRKAAESNPDDQVVQTVYSDGLTHISVFIEPLRGGNRTAGTSSFGATHTLTTRHDQWWVTVIGDVPMATLKVFAESLERRP
jgi:sigma-E factor negative regulatory protein RseB